MTSLIRSVLCQILGECTVFEAKTYHVFLHSDYFVNHDYGIVGSFGLLFTMIIDINFFLGTICLSSSRCVRWTQAQSSQVTMVGRRSALETPRPVSAAWTDVDLWSELEKPMAFCFLGKVQGPRVKHGKSSSKAVIVGFHFEVSLWSGVFF